MKSFVLKALDIFLHALLYIISELSTAHHLNNQFCTADFIVIISILTHAYLRCLRYLLYMIQHVCIFVYVFVLERECPVRPKNNDGHVR